MSKAVKVLFLCIMVAAVVAGCPTGGYYSEHRYFNGAVLVEYKQHIPNTETDSLMIRFNETGLYAVVFSEVNTSSTRVEMPKSFVRKIDEAPIEIVFNQKMPDIVKVTIVTNNGDVESHNFR